MVETDSAYELCGTNPWMSVIFETLFSLVSIMKPRFLASLSSVQQGLWIGQIWLMGVASGWAHMQEKYCESFECVSLYQMCTLEPLYQLDDWQCNFPCCTSASYLCPLVCMGVLCTVSDADPAVA